MSKIKIEQLQRHLKTHTERSDDDNNAVTVLKTFLRSGGKINDNFSERDKWPNIDGTFELVPDPEKSRRPKQNFVVQIKGTTRARIGQDGSVKYQLQNLSFPSYVATEVTLDPCILFLILNPGIRNQERVFWKYISPQFIANIDFNKDTTVIDFTIDDEIENTDESVNKFVKKLDDISDTHSYMKQLESREYTKDDVIKLIIARCDNITDAIKSNVILNYTRDKLSRKILTELDDLCKGTLLLNGLMYYPTINLRVAWELALMDINTKFLSSFLQSLRYIGLRVSENGQYERLMLKYYGFLWKIRKYLSERHNLQVMNNLEDFPCVINDEDMEYNKLLAISIENVSDNLNPIGNNRYYIQRKSAFYVGSKRYFEITLQLADKYATKYNRLTAYSKYDISSNYSIQVGCTNADILLWDKPTKIMVITNWRVSIEPAVLNKLSRLLKFNTKISSRYKEYVELMRFMTQTGINILDFIDFRDDRFNELIFQIFGNTNTSYFQKVLIALHENFSVHSNVLGKNTIRYVLIRLREDLLEDILPIDKEDLLKNSMVYLSKKCYSFECNPVLYNLPKKKTNGKIISKDVFRAIGIKNVLKYLPYIRIKHLINNTGELYYSKDEVEYKENNLTIDRYNSFLTQWDKKQGRSIKEENGYIYLDEYVNNTIFILQNLLNASSCGNDGQKQLNQYFLSNMVPVDIDDTKIFALSNIFVYSKVMMIYGAAGTGKTTLLNYISELMENRSKLFLAKTHTALENLQKRIRSHGNSSEFIGIDKFVNSDSVSDYDIIFVDECSTIDNRTMVQLLNKISKESLLIFAGDTYQIESIDFGNWFFYAKEILPRKAIVELNSTWRTKSENIKSLWEEVRYLRPYITEKLVIDGPFSENIGKNIFVKNDEDEVVLCLNYDGKFGLNSINGYFQDANPSKDVFCWSEWKYKIGDPVLFNDNKRFPMLYNNLKGTIVNIQSDLKCISFTIDIPIVLTAIDVRESDLSIISNSNNSTRISFTVYENDENDSNEDYEEARLKSIVPFQLAYAVSIHKAQGLEYKSIKVVIPNSNVEKITHGIFYTAITRAKEKLKIFWSTDTMNQIINSFYEGKNDKISLEMIKKRLFEK